MRVQFSIGEMSKLHNLPVKTLRYYDDIGLFKPAKVDRLNGYRYYSIEQFEHLNAIKYLKFLGFSLKEIQAHLGKKDVFEFINILKKQQQITDTTIRKLETVSNQFSNRIKEIENSLTVETLGEPIVKQLQARHIIQIREVIHSESEWELALRKLENLAGGNPSLFIGKVGLTVAKESLIKRKFSEYDSVFILWEEPGEPSEMISQIGHGDYVCIYYRGSHSDSAPYYELLLSFIDMHGYAIIGGSIERTIINQFITNDQKLHLTEIQIPVTMPS